LILLVWLNMFDFLESDFESLKSCFYGQKNWYLNNQLYPVILGFIKNLKQATIERKLGLYLYQATAFTFLNLAVESLYRVYFSETLREFSDSLSE
jgi:hypothetical protein